MNLLLLGLTVGVVGKLILGIAVLRVHAGILAEHKIDNVVLIAIKREQWITFLGLSLIVLGYALEVVFYGGTPLLSCVGTDCSAMLEAALE